MVQIKRSEMRLLDDAFGMNSGYVLDFSDRTMSEWFEDELRIDIDHHQYKLRGTSKANRLRCFVENEPAQLVARMLRTLWNYRESSQWRQHGLTSEQIIQTKLRLFALISRLEGMDATPPTDSLVSFMRDETLEELIQAIRRDAEAGKPQAALDRLHTYCMKKFAYLLTQREVPLDRDEPLHSRVGKYLKALEAERALQPITRQIMKNCIGIFQLYNDIRNNGSFAHDNPLVQKDEARFIFETVISMLRFIRAIEAGSFEQTILIPKANDSSS